MNISSARLHNANNALSNNKGKTNGNKTERLNKESHTSKIKINKNKDN